MGKKIEFEHIDIVTSHKCNNNCPNCVDRFIHASNEEVSLGDVEKFLRLIRRHTKDRLEVLLLGGEPTMLETDKLIDIAKLIKIYGFVPIMSTNGKYRTKIMNLLPYYRWIQITVSRDSDIDFWRADADRVNIKLAGDQSLTMEKLKHFIEYTKGYERRSVTMYFNEELNSKLSMAADEQRGELSQPALRTMSDPINTRIELCQDKDVWNFLETLEWIRKGNYRYAFFEGVRFKRCIPGESNNLDTPAIPRLYPNGNYNKTWKHENMDDYLS